MRSHLRDGSDAPAATAATTRSRRRFARRQWARRWLTWKPVVALVLLVVLALGAVWAVYVSSLLAVTGVHVTGVSGARAADVRRAASVADGQPLARVDLDAVRHRVEALAAVESADVTREWPHQVRIDVTERTAVAVVEIAGRIRGMDASGVLFRDYATAPPGLPRVRVSTDTREDALAEAARVVGALPASISGIVDHVEVQTVDQISLVLRDGREVTWGSADQSDLKAEVLTGLLSDVKDAHAYDVSVPEQPTTR